MSSRDFGIWQINQDFRYTSYKASSSTDCSEYLTRLLKQTVPKNTKQFQYGYSQVSVSVSFTIGGPPSGYESLAAGHEVDILTGEIVT